MGATRTDLDDSVSGDLCMKNGLITCPRTQNARQGTKYKTPPYWHVMPRQGLVESRPGSGADIPESPSVYLPRRVARESDDDANANADRDRAKSKPAIHG